MSKWMVSAVAGIVSLATVAIVIKKRKAYKEEMLWRNQK